MKSDQFWKSLSSLEFRSEKEVETRFLVPFFEVLGWPTEEVHADVPVEFQIGRNRGRKPAADLVLAPKSSDAPKKAWIVIEAKKPNEKLENASAQAFSYSYALKAPFFVTTNGIQIQIWQTGFFDENKLIFEKELKSLVAFRGTLEAFLKRDSVIDYCNKHSIDTLVIENIDIAPYLAHVYKNLLTGDVISRRLQTEAGKDIFFNLENTLEELALSDGDGVYVSGWGGNGKTTLLQILISQTLRNTVERRIPFLISLDFFDSNSIFEHIAIMIGPFAPALNTAHAVQDWLKKTKTLIALDNWDKLDDRQIKKIESQLHLLKDWPSIVFLTGKKTIQAPSHFKSLEVSKYSNEERDEVIAKHFKHFSNSMILAHTLLRDVPRGIVALLNEPVILGKYLELFEAQPTKFQTPKNLPDLMDKLLFSLFESRHIRISKKIDEVVSICTKLSNSSKRINLESLKEALSGIGSEDTPVAFAEDMVTCGIWIRQTPGVYAFSHDIWRIHFKSKLIFSESTSSKISDQVKLWMDSSEMGELLMAVPFGVAILNDSDLQEEFSQHLLKKDIELYFTAIAYQKNLPIKDEAFDSRKGLERFLNGYVQLVDIYFPELKPFLYPWSRGDGNEENREEKVIISGQMTVSGLHYYLGFAHKSEPDIILEDERGSSLRPKYGPRNGIQSNFINLQLSGLHFNSSRFIAAEQVLKNISTLIEDKKLPALKWMARERLRGWIKSLRPSNNWKEWTVNQVRDWTKSHAKISQEDIERLGLPSHEEVRVVVSIGNRHVTMEEICQLAEYLIKEDLGEVTLENIGLPGPDRQSSSMYGSFAELYTDEQKVKRVGQLHDAVVKSYRVYCEKIFGKVKDKFLYEQFPCRYCVEIDLSENDEMAGWTNWFEPEEKWDLPTKVSILLPTQDGGPHLFEERAESFRLKCKMYGRKYKGFSMASGIGDWNPWSDSATAILLKLLSNDISNLKNLLK